MLICDQKHDHDSSPLNFKPEQFHEMHCSLFIDHGSAFWIILLIFQKSSVLYRVVHIHIRIRQIMKIDYVYVEINIMIIKFLNYNVGLST